MSLSSCVKKYLLTGYYLDKLNLINIYCYYKHDKQWISEHLKFNQERNVCLSKFNNKGMS